MTITFEDLKAKHLKLVETKWQLQNKLQNKAGELLNEYIESLELQVNRWTDANGNNHRYADIGIWAAPFKFELTPLPRLQMDEKGALNFVIATTLDDNPLSGGYRHGVSIILWYEQYSLNAIVGTDEQAQHFRISENPGAFFEVCAGIKALINVAIDNAMPTAVIL